MKLKKTTIAIFLILAFFTSNCQILTDTNISTRIKSVYLTRDGVELEQPVIRMDRQERLQLSFDLLDGTGENFRYRIIHCDKEWQKDDLEPYEFINGFEEGSIDNYKNSFTTLQDYIYYYQTLPSDYSTFLASGNYILEVFLQDEPDSTMFRRRFWVTEENTILDLLAHKPSGAYGNIHHDQEISIRVKIKEDGPISGINQYLTVKVQQNNRLDLVRTIPFNGYNSDELVYSLHPENVFPGGNCFRYFDLSNIHTPMYNVQRIETYAGEIFAFLRPDENRSQTAYTYNKTLNGGSKVNVWDRHDPQTESDYIWVNFSLPMQFPFLDGNIYIIGDLTQWKFDEESRLEWQPQYKAYTKRLRLKQGYYSYQLVFLPKNASEGETSKLEGDHYETPNNYTVYVYLHTPSDRYDRLIGVKRMLIN